MFSILACSQGYVSDYDLTATALFSVGGAGGGEVEQEITVQPTDQPVEAQMNTPLAIGTPPVAQFTPSQPVFTPLPTRSTPLPPILYYTQAGDTLPAVAVRFGVLPEEITSPESIPATGLINAGKLLVIPNRLDQTGPSELLLPDSEIVFSPSALDFDLNSFISEAGGYLSTYREYLADGWKSGGEVIYKVAIENSINPRLLVALLEYQAHWVYGQPGNLAEMDYPLGVVNSEKKGLYKQLSWAVQQLSIGYYGWRNGILTEIQFSDGSRVRLAPGLNAGSVALQYLFSRLYPQIIWNGVLGGEESFVKLYETMYGDPWMRAQTVEPLLPVNLTQPELILPFLPGHIWSFTGGPHSAWGPDGARAALDFAPAATQTGCDIAEDWAVAVASGLVVRTDTGVVVLDLDGDGYEQTGWAILYLHIASQNRVKAGTWLQQGDLIGHPSCEGGTSTGTHVHIARKYNGEWVLADGPLPFVMDGWRAVAGKNPYEGSLVREGRMINACTCGSFETRISRPEIGN
ncbi:MAG: M23 family metallopeptidase [Chloroflexota bacterium]